jgi:hypothetical protein
MNKLFENYSFEIVFGLVGLLAGFVKVSQRMLQSTQVTWKQVVGHSIISAFSCLMAGMLLDWVAPELPLEAKMFLSGMTGYMGIAGLVKLMESTVGFLKKE